MLLFEAVGRGLAARLAAGEIAEPLEGRRIVGYERY